jgi:hypothetical protein
MWRALKIAHFLGEDQWHGILPRIQDARRLRLLSKSKKADMRYAVAINSFTPIEVLRTLMDDNEWPVRMAVAWHEHVDAEMLDLLLCDPEITVREAATRNPHFLRLYSLWKPGIRRPQDPRIFVAANRLASPKAQIILATCDNMIARAILAHGVRNASLQCVLLEDGEDTVRAGLGANTDLMVHFYWHLALDESEAVRGAVAGNKNVPADVHAKLLRDPSEYVRDRAKYNVVLAKACA